jgi:hypothetical protein
MSLLYLYASHVCAEGGVAAGREVVSRTVPVLLTTWDSATGEDRRQVLAILTHVLTAAASSGRSRTFVGVSRVQYHR